jgi:hypothetical protein
MKTTKMKIKRNNQITRTKLRLPRSRTGMAKPLTAVSLLIMAVLLVVLLSASIVYPDTKSAQYKEYEVKAAFMYNFLKFVNWPKEKSSQDQIIIGIIGEDPFGSAADIFKGKNVEERKPVLKYFDTAKLLKETAEKDINNEKVQEILKCHLLFICPSEQKYVKDIADVVTKHGVLTVGDTDKFTESGVIINFLLEDNKIRFDINLDASEKAGLEMRSQLLRLARKVIKDGVNVTPSADGDKKGK